MKLTNPEKLILVMLSEIHEKLGIRGGTDTKFLLNAIYDDHTWALPWKMRGIITDSPEEIPPEVAEVLNILEMWERIEQAYASFTPSDKKQIEDECSRFGKNVQFSGFDGNNETKYMNIAHVLVEHLDMYMHFKDRDFNAHHPTLCYYHPMLSVFTPLRNTLNNQLLDVSSVIRILNAPRDE